MSKYKTKSLDERFLEKIKPNHSNNCLEWTGAKNNKNYGQFSVGDKKILAHRFAWSRVHGPIPENLCCLHRCDRRECVNIEHLFIGTIADNNRDMVQKDRQAKGEKIGSARLTEENVARIKDLLRRRSSQDRLADEFKVSRQAISDIKTLRYWGYVLPLNSPTQPELPFV